MLFRLFVLWCCGGELTGDCAKKELGHKVNELSLILEFDVVLGYQKLRPKVTLVQFGALRNHPLLYSEDWPMRQPGI